MAAVSILAVVVVVSIGGVAWNQLRKADVPRMISEAELLVKQGGDRAALQMLDEVLASDPGSVAARLLRARVFILQWHFWDAVEEGRAVLQQDPDNWEAHLLIAAAAKRGNLHSVPVDEHLAAVEGRVPDTAEAYFLRG